MGRGFRCGREESGGFGKKGVKYHPRKMVGRDGPAKSLMHENILNVHGKDWVTRRGGNT